MNKQNRNAQLHSLSEHELLVLLGKDLTLSEQHALPIDPEYLMERAEAWVGAQTKNFERAICTDSRILSFCEKGDAATLVTAIADLIAGICTGVSPVTVAYLLVKRGLDKLCHVHWKK